MRKCRKLKGIHYKTLEVNITNRELKKTTALLTGRTSLVENQYTWARTAQCKIACIHTRQLNVGIAHHTKAFQCLV